MSEFFTEALPWAQQVHVDMREMFVSVVLAQWADETAFGGPDWSPRHNPGNVGDTSHGGQVTYPTLQAGVNAYMKTMKLPYYSAVRAATSSESQAIALGQSPWAAGHYGNPPGFDLIQIIHTYDLEKYDQVVPPPPIPVEEHEMADVAVLADGTIVSHAIGTNNHYLEITRKAGTQGQPATTANTSIIDMTQAFNGFPLVAG